MPLNQLYKNTTYQFFQYVLRPISIIIAIICSIILYQNGVFVVEGGTFFLFIPICLFLCVLGNILMVSCIKQFNIKSNIISIDHVNGFKTISYNIKKSDVNMIIAEYKLKKYFFIEPLTHRWAHISNPAELFDFYFNVVLNNGTKIKLKHNVEQLEILDIFEPLTKIISNIQISTPTNISKVIVQTNKLKSYTQQYNGAIWQFNNENQSV